MNLDIRRSRIFELSDPMPDAILVEQGPHGDSDTNVFYVTGVERGGLSHSSVVLRLGERPRIITTRMEAERARRAADAEVAVARNRRERDAAVAGALGSAERVGYNPHGLTAARFRALATLLPDSKWIDVSSALARARAVKDAGEIERIRSASRLTAAGVEKVPHLLEGGMTERDLAAELDYRLRRMGAGGFAFETIVAFGPNAAEPHHLAGGAALRTGDLVLVDAGACERGYCADLTRTFPFGEVGATEARMHAVVSQAQEAALGRLVPGRRLGEVHAAAERVIEASEFAGTFVHALGHSVGLEAQDGVVIHSESDVVIEPGMVFAVEPGVYLPGRGGVRIEDTVLVTERGVETLTRPSGV